MALMQKGVQLVAERMPKVISPKAHGIIDYASAGAFLMAGALLWRKNKRAAVGALLCGAMQAGNVLLTDMPGGVQPVMSFQTHGRVDAGLAGFVAALPSVMRFGGEPEAMLFRGQSVAIAAVTGMTDFSYGSAEGYRRAA
jgi:hypothetical protein